MPNTFFPILVLDPSTSTSQEIGSHNNKKEGNTSLPLPNFDDSQIGGELLRQDHINLTSKLHVYTRRGTHKKTADLSTTLAQDLPLSSSNGSSATPCNCNSSLSNSTLTVFDLDVPIALRKGVQTCTKHSIAKYVSYHRLSPIKLLPKKSPTCLS